MGLNTVPLKMFISTATKWLQALEQDSAADARFYVHELRVAIELLVIDPEFRNLLQPKGLQKPHSHESASIAECVSAFINAITDAGRPGTYRDAGGGTLPRNPSSAS